MIELEDGFFFEAETGTIVKKDGDDRCVLYTRGQSALEGFGINRPALEVATDITEELGELDKEAPGSDG